MNFIYEEALSLKEIHKAGQRCCRGKMKKQSAQAWAMENITKSAQLKKDIEAGSYRPGHGKPFKIYEPKERDILPPLFRDRVWQNDMSQNGVYHDMTHFLIRDNYACQIGKGVEDAVLRMTAILEKYYRRHGCEGYAVHLDIRKYFQSTPRCISLPTFDKHLTEPRYIPHMRMVFDTFRDERNFEEISKDPFGERGTGLGTPVSQLVQLAIPDDIDKALSAMPGVFANVRFMDDIIVICRDKADAKAATELVEAKLAERGLQMTVKGGYIKLEDGFYFLKRKFVLANTGKVLILPGHEKISKERRVLRSLKKQMEKGEKTIEDIERHYESWMSGLMLMDCRRIIQQMDDYYFELFGRRPKYKCRRKSRRYKQCSTRTKTSR